MIESLSNAKVKRWVQYHQKKYRDQEGFFLVEGEHLIEEAARANQLVEVISAQPLNLNVPVFVASQPVLDKLCQTQSKSSMVGLCRKQESTIDSMERLLVCDSIQDPGNLGTMIRTAASFGFDGILLSSGCADVYNEKTIRSSQGAIFYLPIRRGDLLQEIASLKKEGVMIVGTSLEHAIPLQTCMPRSHMAFVLGNEGQGVSKEVLLLCDSIVKIEMSRFESLNVGIATGILCYRFRK